MSNFDILEFIKQAIAQKASDIHLRVGKPPNLRISSDIYKVNMPPLSEEDLERAVNILAPNNFKGKVIDMFDFDFSYEMSGVSRFRINYCKNLARPALTIRMIPEEIPTFDELGLPSSLTKLAEYNNGIILVTGGTGTGKSTTIASMIDYINKTRKKHIITIEDPIEFTFKDKLSIITQRQLGIDTASFHDGIKHALRQDPDVILIGEIRDIETVSSAMAAAETGHLVLATLHTNDAIQTINRVINMFDLSQKNQVIDQIANTFRATISQRLVKRPDNSRVPALEILTVTPTVRDYIFKDQLDDIYDLVKKGKVSDMITMNMSLYKLAKGNIITEEEAMNASDKKNELAQMFRGVFHGTANATGLM